MIAGGGDINSISTTVRVSNGCGRAGCQTAYIDTLCSPVSDEKTLRLPRPGRISTGLSVLRRGAADAACAAQRGREVDAALALRRPVAFASMDAIFVSLCVCV